MFTDRKVRAGLELVSGLGAGVFDADDLGIFVVAPGGAEFDEVEAAVSAEFHVHGALEGHLGAEAFHFGDAIVGVQMHGDDPVTGPFIDEEGVVVFGGEFVFGLQILVEVVDGTGHGGAAAASIHHWEPGGGAVGVVDKGGLGWRQFFHARVVGRIVGKVLRIVLKCVRSSGRSPNANRAYYHR